VQFGFVVNARISTNSYSMCWAHFVLERVTRLQASKLSWYVASYLGQLSLAIPVHMCIVPAKTWVETTMY